MALDDAAAQKQFERDSHMLDAYGDLYPPSEEVSYYKIMLHALYKMLPCGKKADIINGEIVIDNSPTMPEQDNLNQLLLEKMEYHLKISGVGGMVLGPSTLVNVGSGSIVNAREPDIFWIPENQINLLYSFIRYIIS